MDFFKLSGKSNFWKFFLGKESLIWGWRNTHLTGLLLVKWVQMKRKAANPLVRNGLLIYKKKKKIGNDFWISIFLKCSCYIASKNVWNFSLAVVDFFFFKEVEMYFLAVFCCIVFLSITKCRTIIQYLYGIIIMKNVFN